MAGNRKGSRRTEGRRIGKRRTDAARRATGSDFLAGGGEMGGRIREHDWPATPLGVETWPQSLWSAVSILLPSRAQMVLFWGPEFIAIYNDAYAPVFGAKHPWALGRPARECWSEMWPVLGPLFEGVVRTGEAFWAKDHPSDQGIVVPAVALTAYARPEDRDRALAAGFQVHLSKPVEPRALLEAVARLAAGGGPTR